MEKSPIRERRREKGMARGDMNGEAPNQRRVWRNENGKEPNQRNVRRDGTMRNSISEES